MAALDDDFTTKYIYSTTGWPKASLISLVNAHAHNYVKNNYVHGWDVRKRLTSLSRIYEKHGRL